MIVLSLIDYNENYDIVASLIEKYLLDNKYLVVATVNESISNTGKMYSYTILVLYFFL